MSPQYNPDPTQVSAFFHLFGKGDYEFAVGEGKPFAGVNAKGEPNAGIRYPLKCSEVIEGDDAGKGKRQMFTCYIHSEGAMSFSKRFVMACLGFAGNAQAEADFNEQFKGADWAVDPNPEAPSKGEMWQRVDNTRLIISTSLGTDQEGNPSQNWDVFHPITALG